MPEDGPGRASIRDVAARAGVSIASVSRALSPGSKGISAPTRARVREAADALGYSPDRIGRALRAQTTDTYALLISNIRNAFYTAVAWDLERALDAEGKAMLLFDTAEDPARQDRALSEIRARRVNGAFFVCAVESPGLAAAARDLPLVPINRPVASMPGLPFVGIDDRAAAREAMGVLLRKESGRVAVVHGPLTSPTSARRLEGMREALAAAGRAVEPRDVVEAELTMESGYRCAERLMGAGRRFDAVFCGNDPIAYGVARRARELGLAVPEAMRIWGFDDNPMNEWLAPWLNTVRVPHARYAAAALRSMHALHAGARVEPEVLPYELLLRS
jgi:LacI family transcriptional regulator